MPDVPDFVLHNSLTRQDEPLVPSETTSDGRPLLRFYSCGPTVYSYAHIGNFRTFLTADLVVRVAEALGWDVRYVSNVTDVGHLTDDDVADASGEDRMAKALASKEGERFENVWDLARHYTETLLTDWQALNLREPDVRPRATEHVREQIEAVEALVARDHAYETDDGVYFHVPSFDSYGKLSGNTEADALSETAREVVRDAGKKDPRDFALWKKDAAHLMQWHSPYGWGFPGWHLECSVMAQKYLGETIDLHGGGEDLRFPHHECEIAQAEAITGEPFARHWMHTRFLQVEGEKMAKSKGNFLTVRDLTDPEGRTDWGAPVDPLALRFLLISGHYRKPFNFTLKALQDAQKNRRDIQTTVEKVDEVVKAGGSASSDDSADPSPLAEDLDRAYADALAAMCDDLNTPEALAATLRGMARIRRDAFGPGLTAEEARTASGFFDRTDTLLGIVRSEYGEAGTTATDTSNDPIGARADALLAERTEARAAKDWARADALRDEAEALGIEIMDSPDGTTWRRKL